MSEIELIVDSNPEIAISLDPRSEVNLIPDSYMKMIVNDPYTGEYTVDPDFDGVVLPTKNLQMLDDVTVNPIKVETVSNIGGGYTVFIGGII